MELGNVIDYVDEKAVVELTRKLVQIKSVYIPDAKGGNEEQVAIFVANYLSDLGLEVYFEEVVPGRPNVIAIYDSGRPGKTLLFEAHTDVVTEGDMDAWTVDPYAAEIKDGRIYGRGACDTKQNLAAAIIAVKAIRQANIPFAGRILLCIPCDEEGLMIGIKDFIRRGWAEGVDGAIICEPENNEICIAQKGAMRVIVKTFGKMAHGAMPLTGINPINRMAKVIVELEKLERQEKERVGMHPWLGWPSITPTILQAPVKGDAQINVIPDTCLAALDIRTVPAQDHEQLLAQIHALLTRLGEEDADFQASLEVIEDRPCTETAKDDPIVVALVEAYRQVTGREPVYNGVPGATDGTFLHLAGIPIVTTGAGNRYIPHHADEYVEIEQLVETTKLYALAALKFLQE